LRQSGAENGVVIVKTSEGTALPIWRKMFYCTNTGRDGIIGSSGIG
jgi:hypothetical protein